MYKSLNTNFEYIYNFDLPQTGAISNTTTYWNLNIAHENYTIGKYEVEVMVYKYVVFWWQHVTSARTEFYVTGKLRIFKNHFIIY